MLYERIRIPFAGVIPYMDVGCGTMRQSLGATDRENTVQNIHCSTDPDMEAFTKGYSVVRLPRISNFTGLQFLGTASGNRSFLVSRPEELTGSDLIIIPGTKRIRW